MTGDCAYESGPPFPLQTIMFLLKKLITSFVLPPIGPLLLVAAGLLIVRRRKVLGLGLAWSGLALLFALSTPTVAGLLMRTLRIHQPPSVEEARGAQAIVILGGGVYRAAREYEGNDVIGSNSLTRLRYGIELQRKTGLPMLLSGGAPEGGLAEATVMAGTLQKDYGIKARWLETESFDTHEQALRTATLLRKDGVTSILLVTEGFHMRRSVTEFESAGLTVTPAPTLIGSGAEAPLFSFFPGAGSLQASEQAMKEWLGITVALLRR